MFGNLTILMNLEYTSGRCGSQSLSVVRITLCGNLYSDIATTAKASLFSSMRKVGAPSGSDLETGSSESC